MVVKPPLAQEILTQSEREPIPVDMENLTGQAGEPLPAGRPVATEDQIITALKTVEDPEIPVNLYDLGLIYKIQVLENGDVNIEMTLTSPSCPTANELPQQIAEAAAGVKGVGNVAVKVVWEPAWTLERMSDEARFELDLF